MWPQIPILKILAYCEIQRDLSPSEKIVWLQNKYISNIVYTSAGLDESLQTIQVDFVRRGQFQDETKSKKWS